MSSYSTGQRVFTLTIAIVFLLTAIATSGLVIYEITRQNNQAKQLADLTSNKPNETTDITKKPEVKLEGTKLANFTPQPSVAELQKIDTVVGTGEEIKPGATVTAHYTGAVVSTGTIFQSSYDMGEPVEFPLNQVIEGWTVGIPGMKVGGTRRLIIPAAQAYKSDARPGIPANSDLVFDIVITATK